MTLDAAQIVRIENFGEADWHARYDGREYHIPAGESRFLPAGAACIWLGNYDDIGQTRETAVELIKYLYGFNDMSIGSWEDNAPKLRVFNQDTDERMWFPADDPNNLHGAAKLDASPSVTPAASIASLEEQIAELRKAIGQQPVTPSEVPIDKPSRVKVG